jgi:DNA helicase-2/ATP-dependent DNA helicase PcrA
MEEALERAGIPFVRSGESPLISRYPVNILWRFLQTLQSPENPFYREMYHKTLSDAGIATGQASKPFPTDGTLTGLIECAISLHGFECSSRESVEALNRLKQAATNFEGDVEAFLDTLSLERGIDHAMLVGDRVALMSLHAAKGLEWPVVFVTGCEDQLMPCSLFGSRDDEEERRLFYVGMTRARSRLILSHTCRRSLNGRLLTMKPSRFLAAIPEEVCTSLERRAWKPKGRAHKQMELF